MPEFSGSALYFEWVYSGGTVTLHGDYRSADFNPSVDFADASAGSDPRKKRVVTLKDTQVSYRGVAQAGGTALEDALAEGTQGTINMGPEGTQSGKRKYVIGAFSQGAKIAMKYADVVELAVDFMGNGDLTRTTY